MINVDLQNWQQEQLDWLDRIESLSLSSETPMLERIKWTLLIKDARRCIHNDAKSFNDLKEDFDAKVRAIEKLAVEVLASGQIFQRNLKTEAPLVSDLKGRLTACFSRRRDSSGLLGKISENVHRAVSDTIDIIKHPGIPKTSDGAILAATGVLIETVTLPVKVIGVAVVAPTIEAYCDLTPGTRRGCQTVAKVLRKGVSEVEKLAIELEKQHGVSSKLMTQSLVDVPLLACGSLLRSAESFSLKPFGEVLHGFFPSPIRLATAGGPSSPIFMRQWTTIPSASKVTLKLGDICRVRFPEPIGIRPAVILSKKINKSKVKVAPMTTNISKIYPTEVRFIFNSKDGKIVLNDIQTIDKNIIMDKLGRVDEVALREIDDVLEYLNKVR